MPKSKPYEQELLQYLQDSEPAIEYLNAALEEGDLDLFQNALQNVAKAKGKSDRWVEQFSISTPAIENRGQQLFFLLKELGLGLKSIEVNPVELAH
ncbi:DNA-binding protein [Alkalinema pantanalense CENA528]|uniref:helix-turn-helix domain-containing transcriptional regulator n=1 Tax=Alkalinema pantanalense TaxID=1620705 RepID=UPI003D6FAC15